MIHYTDLCASVGTGNVACPPAWLEPLDDSREPAEFKAEDRWIVDLLKRAVRMVEA